MPEITDAELAEYQQLRFLQQQQESSQDSDGEEAPLTRPRQALLADGTTHDYTGMHPTHVDNGTGGLLPVVTCREL